MKEEIFGYSLLLIVRKKRDEGLFSRIIWCLPFSDRVNAVIMSAGIPFSGNHSRGCLGLNDERMVRHVGEWMSFVGDCWRFNQRVNVEGLYRVKCRDLC